MGDDRVLRVGALVDDLEPHPLAQAVVDLGDEVPAADRKSRITMNRACRPGGSPGGELAEVRGRRPQRERQDPVALGQVSEQGRGPPVGEGGGDRKVLGLAPGGRRAGRGKCRRRRRARVHQLGPVEPRHRLRMSVEARILLRIDERDRGGSVVGREGRPLEEVGRHLRHVIGQCRVRGGLQFGIGDGAVECVQGVEMDRLVIGRKVLLVGLVVVAPERLQELGFRGRQ